MQLSRFPLLGDYLNRRARPGRVATPWFEWGATAAGAVTGAVASITGVWKLLLPNTPFAAGVLRAVVPAALGILSVTVVTARRRDSARLTDNVSYEYRYGVVARTVAKISLPLLIALALYRGWQILPNRVTGHARLEGSLCGADGLPIDDGRVEVHDEFGQTVSKRRERIDSLGFFVVDLDPWAFRPTRLVVSDPGCPRAMITPLNAASGRHRGCPASGDDADDLAPTWTLSCGQEAR